MEVLAGPARTVLHAPKRGCVRSHPALPTARENNAAMMDAGAFAVRVPQAIRAMIWESVVRVQRIATAKSAGMMDAVARAEFARWAAAALLMDSVYALRTVREKNVGMTDVVDCAEPVGVGSFAQLSGAVRRVSQTALENSVGMTDVEEFAESAQMD